MLRREEKGMITSDRSIAEGWRALTGRIAALAMACCVVIVTSAHPSPAQERAELPSTAAGQAAAAYFDAFNSVGDDEVRAFLGHYRSPSYLQDHPVDERLAYYQRLRGIFGRLTPLRVTLSLELQLTLLAEGTEIDGALVMRFQLEDEPPFHIAYVTFTGIDHPQAPDEYVAYVAARATPIDEALRESTIDSVAGLLRSKYVYPELGQRMADVLLQHRAEGRYDDLGKAGRLADQLTSDALAVSDDRHIWVEAQNPMVQESTDPMNRPVERLRRDNYDFRRVEVLPGNIGYLKFDMFHDDEEALRIAAAALAFAARCDVLIFDIRDNIGGEPGTAELLLGYLFPAGTVFGHLYDRDGRLVRRTSTPDTIPGEPFDDDLPVYVLTSDRTGSAAEGFAYNLKQAGRATIVGEVTRGAAHPSEEVVVGPNFRMSIPIWRSENVITGTSWEGIGVLPQIEVAADRALEAAVEDALRRISNRD
jgi:hypothetical protein